LDTPPQTRRRINKDKQNAALYRGEVSSRQHLFRNSDVLVETQQEIDTIRKSWDRGVLSTLN